MGILKKIGSLVNRGYKEAAFSKKENAQLFAAKWKSKGYGVDTIRSSGPTVEGYSKKNAYYVVAHKKTKPKPRQKAPSPFGFSPQGFGFKNFGMRLPKPSKRTKNPFGMWRF